jgi:hypothetical protein
MKTISLIVKCFCLCWPIWAHSGELDRSPWTDLYADYRGIISTGMQPNEVRDLNSAALEELYQYAFEKDARRAGSISLDQAQMIMKTVEKNPVVSMDVLDQYDHENIGFCFGRATFIHLELLRRGVQKEAIKKVFAVGPMKSFEISWQFHVTTIVKGTEGRWWAIDPYVGKVISVEDWFDRINLASTNGKLRFYLIQPGKVGPTGGIYEIKNGGLFDPFYRNYFKDMFEYFKNNPLRADEKFNFNPQASENSKNSCETLLN